MTQILMQYLPRALAIIFVVNAANSGGVAKDRLLKILYDFSSYCDKHKIEHPDESRAIFLVNKWDSISRKEKDKVLTYIQQNLKETWPGFQPHQLKTCSFMKMEESIAVEIAERTTEDRTELEKFRELQQMIGDVVSLSLIARYTDAFLWLQKLTNDVFNRMQFRKENANVPKMRMDQVKRVYENHRQKIETMAKHAEETLKADFQKNIEELAKKVWRFLMTDEVKKSICTWADLPDGVSKSELKEEGEKLVISKLMSHLKFFEDQSRSFADFAKGFKQAFAKRKTQIEEYLEKAAVLSGDSDEEIASSEFESSDSSEESPDSDVEDEEEDFSINKGTMAVALGTSVLWVPLGLAALIVTSPAIASWAIHKTVKNRGKKKYMEQLSKEIIQVLDEEEVRKYVWKKFSYLLEETEKYFHHDIPKQLEFLGGQYDSFADECTNQNIYDSVTEIRQELQKIASECGLVIGESTRL